MEPQLYEKVHEVWKDRPDESTPCYGRDLMHFEQGIYNNSANIKELATPETNDIDFSNYFT